MMNEMFKLASLALVAGFVTSSFDAMGMNADNTQKNVQNNQQSMSSKIEIVSFNNDGKEGLERRSTMKFEAQYGNNTVLRLSCNIDLNDPLKSVKNLFDVIAVNMPSTSDVIEFIRRSYAYGREINNSDDIKNLWTLNQAAFAYNQAARKCGLRTIDTVKFAGDSELVEISPL